MSAARDWTVFDRPELAETLGPRRGDRVEALLALEGLHCSGCVARTERLLAGQVEQVHVNLAARTVSFEWQPTRTPISKILGLLDEGGLQPRVLAQENSTSSERGTQRRLLLRLGVATICAMQVMMLAWPTYSNAAIEPDIAQLLRWSEWLIAVPGVLWAGWPFFAGAAAAVRARSANMDLTIALALAVAFGASTVRVFAGRGDLYLDTATMFVWLLLLGRWLEGRTRRVAGERLRLLAGRRALTARRCSGRNVETVPIAALAIGDEVSVATGEALPADATLLDAGAELDESLLTGESRPVAHRSGDALLAGSLNTGAAALHARITRIGAETTLAQITRLLDGAQGSKPAVQRLADRHAGRFVLAIVAIAAAAFAWKLGQGLDIAINTALAVLVASCPCALSLAVPIVLAATSSRLAASGVLVANPDALLRLAKIDTVVFDKTGTLTERQLAVRRVLTLAERSDDDCLGIAVGLECDSQHPIAEALRQRAAATGVPLARAASLRNVVGGGVEGSIDGHRYWLGAAERAPLAVPLPGDPSEALSWVVLLADDRALAAFAFDAPLRAEAPQAVAALNRRGLSAEILSGDSQEAAAAIGSVLGVLRVRARLQPEQKLARLKELRRDGARVLAVGDGFNDAPLLAAADVSAALPHGAALTQSKADLILVGDSLLGLPLACELAQAARRRMRENLAWALAYNALVLPLAVSGALQPWMAAAGMSASSLLVAVNALRLGGGAGGN